MDEAQKKILEKAQEGVETEFWLFGYGYELVDARLYCPRHRLTTLFVDWS